MKKTLSLAAILGFLALWVACHLGTENTSDNFDIEGDSTWTACDSILIELLDKDGNVIDTLFNDSLHDVGQLKRLAADKYQGGEARIHIKGVKGGQVCVEQNRTFDGDGGPVTVDTVRDPGAKPVSVDAKPDDTLELSILGTAKATARVLPAYADQGIQWSLQGGSLIVSFVKQPGKQPSEVVVTGLNLGVAKLVAASAKDSSIKDVIHVKVVNASSNSITLSKDTVKLFQGGPGDTIKAQVLPAQASQAVNWKTTDTAVAKVDAKGFVTPGKAGQTYVVANSPSSSLSASAIVIVKRDVPRLTIVSKSGAPVNVEIVFNAHVKQDFGVVETYAYDLDGDGGWDATLKGPWSGDSADLPAVKMKYDKEGQVTAKFLVIDGEGNEATAQVVLDIGNQPPEILSVRGDTIISIKDSIAMTAKVRDADGNVAFVAWDYDGDGKLDDSLAAADSVVEVQMGHRYIDAGTYGAVLVAGDANGKTRRDTVIVKVEADPPVADAGPDTTVLVNALVKVSAKGTDKFGTIVKRELSVGGQAFVSLSSQDTTITAPAKDTVLRVVVRVTDDDGQEDSDTMLVTVILSANADLESLAFSAGSLVPEFKPNILSYSAKVGNPDSAVTVTPKAKDGSATITVNSLSVASGSPSAPVKLQVGTNNVAFKIVVTAADGTQRTYVVDVARDPNANASLSKLETVGFTLDPAFSAATVAYVDTVPWRDSSIALKPTAAFPGSVITVNDSAVVSGTFTQSMPLKVGVNVFKIQIVAQDEVTKTVYTVTVVRLAKLLVFRKVGGLQSLVDSLDTPLGKPVQITSPGATGYRFVSWTVQAGSGILADSASNPTSLTPNAPVVQVGAEFFRVFNIVAAAGPGGTIKPEGRLTVDSGSKLAFVIKPVVKGDSIHRLLALYLNKKPVEKFGDTIFNIDAVTGNVALEAFFLRRFRVTAAPAANFSPNDTVVDSLDTVSVILTPPASHRVTSFTDNDVEVTGMIGSRIPDAPRKYAIPAIKANHALKAAFKRLYVLTTSITEGRGFITSSRYVDEGDSVTVSIEVSGTKPDSGWHLSALTDGGADVLANVVGDVYGASTYKIAKMDGPRTVAATLTRKAFSLAVNGYNICVYKYYTCPDGQLCLSPCFRREPIHSTTVSALVGDVWSISTSDTSSCGSSFVSWGSSLKGAGVTSSTWHLVTAAKANETWTASYVRCRIIYPGDPSPTPATTAPPPEQLQSMERPREQSGEPGGSP